MNHSETIIAIVQNDIKYIRETVDKLAEQVRMANGRTKKLEIFKAWSMGFCACISIIILPIIMQFVMQLLSKSS